MRLTGGLFGLGQKFHTESLEDIELILEKHKKMQFFPTFGEDEKIALIAGDKSIGAPYMVRIIITNKRIIMRDGLMSFDQYPFKQINSITTEGKGMIKSLTPVFVLADGKRVNLFYRMKFEPKLAITLNASIQEQWANRN